MIERVWFAGQLSRKAAFRLIGTSDFGPREIDKLILILAAHKTVLEWDDAEAVKAGAVEYDSWASEPLTPAISA